MRIAGKSAIVTGGASGIGKAIAALFAEHGASVLITDLQEVEGKQTADEITAAGGRCEFLKHDVRSAESWQAVMDGSASIFGGLNIVVNNAGVGTPYGSVEDLSLDDWQKVMAVNSDGVFLGTKFGIEAIRRAGNTGSIINFSSTMAMVGSPTTAAYVASKGAVRSFTKSAALHCAKNRYDIRVNSVHPGWIRTPMSAGAIESLEALGQGEKASELTPLGRLGEPKDIAFGVLYLASDESSYVTGSELVIDGGYLAQ